MSDNIQDLYPLSPLQGGMLFHAISEPGQGLYFNQLVCELRRLDVRAFTQAWEAVVLAHPILRTALVWDDVDEPVQVVLREVELPIRVEDWRGLEPDARDSRWESFLEEDRREGIDLSQAPLVRLALMRVGEDAYRFVFSHSHLILDGWSVPLVLRDVFAAYEDALAGRPLRLVPPRPFGDYIGWLAEHDLTASESFWRQTLKGFREPTPLRAGPDGSEGHGRATRSLHLSEERTSALNALARRQGLTVSSLVQGAWALVLGHLSGAGDVVFGTIVSGRPPDLPGVEDMVGLFINTQPVRVRLTRDVSSLGWLRSLQDAQLEARQHEHAPLVKVQRWSDVPAGTPLFESLVVFENYPLDAALSSSAKSLSVHDVRAVEEDHFALTLVSMNGARLPLHLRYDRARFTAAFADAQLERLRFVLERWAEHAEDLLEEVARRSEHTRHPLVLTWADPRQPDVAPEPGPSASPAPPRAFEGPRDAKETTLAAIWAQVFGRERVDIHDNFFELGGDSIVGIQVIARAAQAGLRITAKQLFDQPTVARLAAVASEVPVDGASAPMAAPETSTEPSRQRRAEQAHVEEALLAEGEVGRPLSFAQERLWFLDQLEPGSASYNVTAAVRLVGPLDAQALERGFHALVQRHESLRTTFRSERGVPVQVIAPDGAPSFQPVDLSGLPESIRGDSASRLLKEEVLRPFDLVRGPLLRASLVKLAPEEHLLVMVIHHIVSDGWSIGVLVREWVTLYQAHLHGMASPLPPLPMQYADFAQWQRGWLRGEVLEAQVRYWRQQLEGAPRALELPTDKPRPAAQTFRGRAKRQVWPQALWQRVVALSRAEGATPFMVLVAAYQTVLWRHSGQDDISVGFPIAGRTHAQTEGLIGYFANTLVLRARVRPEATFRELLAQVREATLGAYAHQDVPFEKLVEALLPERDLSRSPLFQVSLTLLNTPQPKMDLGRGLALSPVEAETHTSKFDLSLMVEEAPEGVMVSLNYNSDLFEDETAERLLRHVRVLLEAAVESPGQRLEALPLMGAEERQRLVEVWSGRTVAYPREASLAELFEAQVEETPDAVAVEDRGETLTYAALNRRANQLAHHLRGMGVGPEVRVGVCVERSLAWVVSMLGVVKAGGVYVPLDASYPLERLGWMKSEARVALLVAQEKLADEMASGSELVVSVDTEWDALIARQPESNLRSGASGGNLAYVMFTSGSTGRPKGVGVPQRAVTRLVMGSGVADFGPREVWLQLAPTAFDASTLEVWGALLHGGKLVVYPEGPLELEALARTLEETGITSLWLTAALFEQMQAYQPQALRGVRQVLAGGDVLPVGRVRERVASGAVLINGYGPTEGTTFTSVHRMETVEDVGPGAVPIGGPVANTRVYVLDARLRPVPAGVRGELYVGGDGLAVGYVGRPELTAERFVPSPFGDGERLYRTGDEARWLGNGTLEFLGRRDTQVKVRGFRIELGEVEEALKQQAGVEEAAAVVREEGWGGKRLVAYVVAPGGDGAALKESVKQRLPEYMVPSTVVVLEALPLTPNGKVDRKALQVAELAPQVERQAREPRTPTEHQLLALWREVLGTERVNVEDDFFELGGHSLLATQLVAHVRSAFSVELPLRAIFESPTLEALAARIEGAGSSDAAAGVPPLVPAPRTDAMPVSFAQQRLWFIDQLHPGSAVYNVPIFLRLEGTLSVEALQQALSALVDRHESLRTTFASREGQPVQVIHPAGAFRLAFEDLGAWPTESREAELQARTAREALRPFDLRNGPLLRATVTRLSPASHTLLLVLHHIISDGWSLGVLVREVGALYTAFQEGRPPALPPMPVQYADFSVWQRRWLQGDALEAQLAWWRKQLSGAPPYLELPTDKPRPVTLSHQGAAVPVRLSRSLSDGVTALAQAEGATPFMVLLAAFQLLLSRYAGQEDVVVGSPIAGRRYQETEGLIGFFVNTLVLRAEVRPEETFRDLLAQVRERTLGAYEHQDVPFEKLVEHLQPERSLGRSPLFQVLFVLQNAPVGHLALPSLAVKPQGLVGTEAARFELSLNLGESPEGFSGILQFSTDLFTQATAARVVTHLQRLLESVSSAPAQRLSDVSLLAEAERQQVLGAWDAPGLDVPRAAVHQRFEQAVAASPDAPAVRCEDEVLSFRELDARANQLAHHLRGLGVGADVPVALCLERGAAWVVSMLGVLKAGGAYVPLDSTQPASRLQDLVAEVAAPVVITQARHAQVFGGTAATVVQWDADAATLEQHARHSPACEVHPDQLAYVLFTSGSTGRPKGVAVSHGQLAHYVHAVTERLDLTTCASFALVSTVVADLGNTVLFPALCSGGLLHVLTQERATSPAEAAEYFARFPVDCMKIVPAHLAALMTAAEPGRVLPKKRLVLGGESSSWSLLEQVHALAPACQVFNHYGPTETTVGVVAGPVALPRSAVSGASVPLGRALAHTRLYVLDAALRPVPVGIPGELYVGGAQVTRGYLRRPDLTAERYVPDPYSLTPGARMYRTGDKVRWLEDGRVEFIGRTDFQVKVRGFRVEPGEVAGVLRAHPGLRDAVVVAREDAPGDKRLVAYAVPAEAPGPETAALRAYLQERLPAHMVPSALVVLEALPLTANGKVDWRALPAPEASARDSSPDYEAPASPLEETLASVWAQVLRVERVGRKDDFFGLGGHSLLATQVVARLRAALGVEVPLRALFESPSLRGFAQRVALAARSEAMPGLHAQPRSEKRPLSFAQQRLWFLDRLQPGSTAYNVPLVLNLEGPLDVEVLERAFSELVRRHEVLRTTFPVQGEAPVQVILPAEALRIPVVDLRGQEDTAARRFIRAEVDRPFDLARAPALRTHLLKLAEARHVLVMMLHHIVSDGWSMGILVRELSTLHEAFSHGNASPLPELPVQYADYSQWQRDWLKGEALEAQVRYWRQQLEGAPRALELPTDRPRPAVQTFRGAVRRQVWPQALWQRVESLGRSESATPFMVLLAAYQTVLWRHSGQDDISVGFPIAGRTHAQTEGLIGYFANTLVLRARVKPEATFRELLAQVREVTVGAYAHQDVPFEKLVEELRPERDLSRSPLFQVSLTLQNTPPPDVKRSEGLSLKVVDAEIQTSKFDLSLFVGDAPGGVYAALNYNSDLFDGETAERLLGHMRVLLEAAVASPGQRLEALPLMGAEERQQLVEASSGRAVAAPREATLAELFEAQVEQTPDAVAVTFESEHVTYRELEARANQLAHFLQGMGVGVESLVGVCLERSVDMVVALLGVLKAGAAYVPLDPAYPRERLVGMLEDSGAAVLLTHERHQDVLASAPVRVVLLDAQREEVSRRPATRPAVPRVGPEALAYVIFTSGSTGRPKGAMNAHGAIVNRLRWMQREYGLGGEDVVLQKTPFSFDVSVWEFFWPLSVGARLVVARPGGHQEPAYLTKVLKEERVSTVHFVPSMLRAFLEEPGLEGLSALRRVVCSGEALDAELVKTAYARLPETVEVHNLYGPTEAAVDVTYWPCPRDARLQRVPIGKPVANTALYVLDGQGQPAPVGIPGELHIGGVQVGRGYRQRPELTAERFIPDAFSGVPGARLYRTGDVTRWLPDGTLEYLGRADFQVKLRGFRIELGEVEAALRGHPGVRDAVAVVRQEARGDARLIAYVTGEAEPLTPAALQAHLRKQLPSHMVPSVVVRLDVLPLTPSGKVDRKALPVPEAPTVPSGQYVAPRTPTEEALADIFSQVLGGRRVGVHDGFFELGGHSLLATQVVVRVRAQFGVELPLRALFESPSVAKLTGWLDGAGTDALVRCRVALQPEGSGTPVFLVHAVGGAVGPYRELARRVGASRPVYAFQAAGLDGREPPLARIEALARRYVESMREVQPEGPYVLGGWSLGGVVAFEMARELERQGQRVALLALMDSFAPDEKVSAREAEGGVLLARMAMDLARMAGAESALRPEDFAGLGDEAQLSTVVQHARQAGWLPPEVEVSVLRAWRDVMQANLRALAAYRPGPLRCPVLLLRAKDARRAYAVDPSHGWAPWLPSGLTVEDVPGDHYSALRPPHVETLARRLAEHVDAATGGQETPEGLKRGAG
ncbi:non-ribosomal peptide synthetase [Corallococcus macrosporus]|uniref:Non-ribosomal peptide synthetase n=1 Tax=Corallococcus macrosporus DSM 14697 TaxID=1189310 RepID=A0A250JWP7_9BACT|nr:non-ribosomal peptide synthetase [Corallococcus macrosporus]ATB48289.1 non-ribosomal peptide synthetase [Corallococcus macrosporus DSM 14697]